ncbi:MAG: LysR family transcriptional regulator [Acidaminococcaceae bacterium]|jgi:Transcriptional regulator|nr:LysR family transcriptional regulator [Acidaminococcaceae bacterium]NLU44681.1 LysR family transcriptional regulator [Acholeplasmataceae bacterium]
MSFFTSKEANISSAAEILHITQPTLSRQISELEKELGVQLFNRGKRKTTLADAGLLFRRRAEEIS